MFDRYLAGLPTAQATAVCQAAVPQAVRLTTGQLAVLLRRMVIAVDSDAAARWYRQAITERDVISYPAPDGAITLSATGLPADEAEAACVRLQQLALAAKRAGHPGRIGQFRADLCLGLLDGRFHRMTRDQVIAALIADHQADHRDADHRDAEGGGAPDDAGTGSGGAGSGGAGSGGAGSGGAGSGGAGSGAVLGRAGRRPRPTTRRCPTGARPRPGTSGSASRSGSACPPCSGSTTTPPRSPASGFSRPPDARRRVALQHRAEWRFALTEPEGALVFDGVTRRRPHNARRDGPPGGIVELHFPVTLLADLAADPPPAAGEWTEVIADISAQRAAADDYGLDLDARPDARLPGAALRRHTEIRDRTCTFLGCRHRAHTAQQDHTRDHHDGGATVRANLGPLCAHDHRVKHQGGWQVEQTTPGRFLWRSPLGGRYRTGTGQFLPPCVRLPGRTNECLVHS